MLEWGVGHDGSGAMSKALAGNRMVMLDADDAAAVLSLELEKDRARRRGSNLAKKLLSDLERKLSEREPGRKKTK
jgi:hypothetical protein